MERVQCSWIFPQNWLILNNMYYFWGRKKTYILSMPWMLSGLWAPSLSWKITKIWIHNICNKKKIIPSYSEVWHIFYFGGRFIYHVYGTELCSWIICFCCSTQWIKGHNPSYNWHAKAAPCIEILFLKEILYNHKFSIGPALFLFWDRITVNKVKILKKALGVLFTKQYLPCGFI